MKNVAKLECAILPGAVRSRGAYRNVSSSLHLNDFLSIAEEQYMGLELLLKTATSAKGKGNSKMGHRPG